MINTNLSWFEIYDRLRARIKSGGLRAEAGIDRREVMPDAPENEFGMAVARLVDEGLLRENDDHTLKVAKPRARSRRSASFEEDYTAQGRKPVVRTLSWELLDISETPAFVQETLADTHHHMVARHFHVQSVDAVPHAIADSYIPYELIKTKWVQIKQGQCTPFEVLNELGYKTTHKRETLYVDQPTAEERKLLEIMTMPGLPVVRLDCQVLSNDTIIEVCLLCDRSDLYEFSYEVAV